MEAQYHRHKHVLQAPKLRLNIDEEFIAEENLLLEDKSVSEGATHYDVTTPTSNMTKDVEQEEERKLTRVGPLMFDVAPPLDATDRVDHIAANDQAELMR